LQCERQNLSYYFRVCLKKNACGPHSQSLVVNPLLAERVYTRGEPWEYKRCPAAGILSARTCTTRTFNACSRLRCVFITHAISSLNQEVTRFTHTRSTVMFVTARDMFISVGRPCIDESDARCADHERGHARRWNGVKGRVLPESDTDTDVLSTSERLPHCSHAGGVQTTLLNLELMTPMSLKHLPHDYPSY